MIPKANYHTHTKYCDGKNTAAEMAKAAFDKGFTHLVNDDWEITNIE